MKTKLLVLALAAMIAVPAFADDSDAKKEKKSKGKRGANPAAQLIKKLGDIGLTDAQKAKIQELAKASQAEAKKLQEAGGITAELLKKRRDAQAKLKDSDKKGKERMAEINAAAGFTEAHAEVMKKVNALRGKMMKDVIAMLTDEQKAKLPKGLTRGQGKAGAKKPAGEKKKKAAAE